MPHKKLPKSSKYRKAGLLAGVLVVATVIAALLIIREHTNKPADIQPTQTAQQPAPKSPLEISLTSDKPSYAFGDTITFKSTVRNISSTPHTYTFTTTCTQGTLYINEQATQTDRICGYAITRVILKPGDARQYTYAFKVVRNFSKPVVGNQIESRGEVQLRPGKYQAYLQWQKDTSAKVDFSVTE